MTALFEEMRGQPSGYVDLDCEARHSNRFDHHAPKSTFLVPEVAQELVDDVHRRLNIKWSFGGWLEVRRALWRGGYMAKGENFLHLGVDFNVPAGTTVFATRPMEIVRIDNDHPEEGGWGTRVIMRVVDLKDAYLIFAHLQPTVPYKVGRALIPGEAFAWVGDPSNNGGWFAHLHVQAVTGKAWRYLMKDDLRTLDGYGNPFKMNLMARRFPNPLCYLGQWQE